MKKAAFHNLGCKVNAYELDCIQEAFAKAGYEVVPFDDIADVYVVNTCTVTNIADRKSRQMLHRARKMNPEAIVVATGCYVQTAADQVEKDEAIDLFVGNNQKGLIVDLVEQYINTNRQSEHSLLLDIASETDYEEMNLTTTMEHTRAYIKIQDGCNQFCSYCAIPYARGRVRSRDIEDIVKEVQGLVNKGYKEIVLTGIHISSFGVDFNKEKVNELIPLLKRLNTIEGLARIRLGSLEPRIISDRFVSELVNITKLCPHFHLSLQSGCDTVLKRMNRHYTTEEYMKGVTILRSFYDNPAITTDIIAGFPGETDEEFEEGLEFIKRVEFFETHIFKYSRRKGTVADKMPNQVPDMLKQQRSNILIKLSEENKNKYLEKMLGEEIQILLEEEIEIDGDKYMLGHTPNYCQAAVAMNEGVDLESNTIVGGIAKAINDKGVIIVRESRIL